MANYITRHETSEPITPNITNCGDVDYDVAVRMVESVQSLSRPSYDKSYHLILSFHPQDNLSAKRLAYIESECCKILGFDEHQRISALHLDTKNPHLHIAVNRVHPKTHRQITPYFSHNKLAKFCQRMELELGLIADNHEPKHGHSISDKAQNMEVFSSKVSLQRFVYEEVVPQLDDKEDLRIQLGRFGLKVLPKGEGFVIGDGETFVKASTLGKNFTLNSICWEKDNTPNKVAIDKVYQPVEPDALWAEYQKSRNLSLAARKALREKNSISANDNYQKLKDKYALLREEIRRDSLLSKKQKFALYKRLGEARLREYGKQKVKNQTARQNTRNTYPLPTWQEFLVDKTIAGDLNALKKLQNQVSKRGLQAVLKTINEKQIRIDEKIIKALEEKEISRKQKSKQQEQLKSWVSARNEMVGKVSDIQEHQLFGKQEGDFLHQGTRQIAENQFVALLSREGITFVKPISSGQQRFLKTIRRGSLLTVDASGKFHKKQVKRRSKL